MTESINSYSSKNNNKLINNTQFIEVLYTKVKNGLKRPLSNGEKNTIVQYLSDSIPSRFRDKSLSQICDIYAQFFLTEFKKNNCLYDKIDTHELNKSQIGLESEIKSEDFTNKDVKNFVSSINLSTAGALTISSLLGITNINDIISKIAPSSVIKYEYITLDSKYRTLDSDGTRFFRWNAIYDNSDIQGGFNISQRVRDIVAIKCLPAKMPYVSTADNDYGRITLLLQEFQSQSFIAHENTRYHFVFASDVDDRWIHLRSHNYNEGLYRFATPITQLSTLTISLSSPWQPIIFDTDRLTMTVSDYVTANKTYFTSAARHNLETGDLVYISNFNTRNPSSDASIIGAVNNVYGNTVTYVDDFTFYIDVNSSRIYNQGPGTINVTNGSADVIGVGTTFITSFSIGDRISISNVIYTISSINTNLLLILTQPYVGTTGSFNYFRDNRIPGLQTPTYFGSKRLFLNFEIAYLDTANLDN